MENNPSSRSRPLHILCLDGGGVCGISSLLMLRKFMGSLQVSLHSRKIPRPCQVFDMICGTSTGGLIAIMLGRLRMTVEEAISSYLHISKQVYGNPKDSRSDSHAELDAHYDSVTLEKLVIELVANYNKGDGQASLKDPHDGTLKCCPTFVVAARQRDMDSSPKLFRTFSTNQELADRCKIWEAVRATTAERPFFEPVKIGSPGVEYMDGLYTLSHNPAQIARLLARSIFPGRKISCFLSLGTGVPKAISSDGSSAMVREACMNIIKSCELVHDAVGREFLLNNDEGAYFRFSPGRGAGDLKLNEWKFLPHVTALTEGYLAGHTEERRVRKCVEALRRDL